MFQLNADSIINYLHENTMQFAQAVCSTLHDIIGGEYAVADENVQIIHGDRIMQTYTVNLTYFGIVTGDYCITMDEASAKILSLKILPSMNDKEQRLTFGGLLKETLNIAASNALQHLEQAIGPMTVSPPIFVYGELSVPKITNGLCRVNGTDLTMECSCSINLAKYEVVSRLRHATDKLDRVAESQAHMLIRPNQIPHARFSVFYKSLQEAGGDLYDVIRLADDSFGYFVGDVSGHEICSGFTTSALKALLRQNISPGIEPTQSFVQINNMLCKLLEKNEYVTACYALLNRQAGRLQIINMGHPPMVLVPFQGEIQIVKGKPNTLLGIIEDLQFSSMELNVNAGDRLILFTDGLVELKNKKVWSSSLGNLVETAKGIFSWPLHTCAEKIFAKLLPPQQPPTDDVLVMVIEV